MVEQWNHPPFFRKPFFRFQMQCNALPLLILYSLFTICLWWKKSVSLYTPSFCCHCKRLFTLIFTQHTFSKWENSKRKHGDRMRKWTKVNERTEGTWSMLTTFHVYILLWIAILKFTICCVMRGNAIAFFTLFLKDWKK